MWWQKITQGAMNMVKYTTNITLDADVLTEVEKERFSGRSRSNVINTILRDWYKLDDGASACARVE